jgi:hypothetical protein
MKSRRTVKTSSVTYKRDYQNMALKLAAENLKLKREIEVLKRMLRDA